jgi:hypothetical protein
MIDVGTLGERGPLHGINNRGQVVGESSTAGGFGVPSAFLGGWPDDRPRRSAGRKAARRINDRGRS